MARIMAWVAALFVGGYCLVGEAAEKPDSSAEVRPFLRSVVKSLLNETQAPDFAMADKVFALDNGEQITKEQLKKAFMYILRKVDGAWTLIAIGG